LDTNITGRKILFQGNLFNVQRLDLEFPNGKSHHYDQVVHRDSVTILPVDQHGNIWFVTQYRVGAERDLLELPAGVLEAGESPEDCARREAREEIGMAAKEIKLLGSYFIAPGYCTEMNHAYLLTDLYSAPLQSDEDEFLNISRIPIKDAYEMALNKKVEDAKSLAALLLARPYIEL
jgi:ADP-ribose pyrophosphatase